MGNPGPGGTSTRKDYMNMQKRNEDTKARTGSFIGGTSRLGDDSSSLDSFPTTPSCGRDAPLTIEGPFVRCRDR